jgi:hypothetical protein
MIDQTKLSNFVCMARIVFLLYTTTRLVGSCHFISYFTEILQHAKGPRGVLTPVSAHRIFSLQNFVSTFTLKSAQNIFTQAKVNPFWEKSKGEKEEKITMLKRGHYVCHAARLQCQTGIARTTLGPIVAIYVCHAARLQRQTGSTRTSLRPT